MVSVTNSSKTLKNPTYPKLFNGSVYGILQDK